MKLRKALSVILAVCMVLSSVSVAYAGEIPEITETEIVGVEETVTDDQEVEVKTESIEEVEEAITEGQEVEAKAESSEEKSEADEANADAGTDDNEVDINTIQLKAELEDVIVTLDADADAFDNKGELSLSVTPVEITDEKEKKLDGKETENVAKRVTYDITVLDNNEEIEPVKEVTVSFELKDAPSGADGVNIYHHDGTDVENVFHETLNENPVAEASIGSYEDASAANTQDADEVSEEELESYADVVIIDDVTVDSFSYYTIDFTYKDKTVSINGDTTANKLDDIVSRLGIEEKVEEAKTYQTADCSGEDTDGKIKNAEGETLFTVYESGDTWYVDAENAFQTEHGLVIKTADGSEYKIKVTDDASTPLTFTAETAGSTIKLNYVSGSNIETSLNGGAWSSYTDTITLTNVNDKVSFKGKNVKTDGSYHFSMTGKIAASGDVTSLTNGTGGNATLTDKCYSFMFSGCNSLTVAPSLPASTLAQGCYRCMFDGCTSLIAAPTLPATTLADECYNYMFDGCTSLITAPTLPATTLAKRCYSGMFYDCTSLITAPALPATPLKESCYASMFKNCTALKTAPELPATTLADMCYSSMFNGCTNLITAPLLPATTLADECYSSMFSGCTSLTTPPSLPAKTLVSGCYYEMFNGCSNLEVFPDDGDNLIEWVKTDADALNDYSGKCYQMIEHTKYVTNTEASHIYYIKKPATPVTNTTSGSSSSHSSSYTTGWHPSGNNWQYVKPDGSFAKNEWLQIDLEGEKKWYHFGNDTMMDTGWFRDTDGTWYYLNKENNKYIGTMYLGWLTDPQDGYRYYLDPANGKMHTGWHVVDGKKHYFCEGSATASGWTQDANLEWVYDKRNVIPLGAMIQ